MFLRILLPFLFLAASCTRMLVPLPPEEQPLLPPLYEESVLLLDESARLALVHALNPAMQKMQSWNDLAFAIDQSLDFLKMQPSAKTALTLGDKKITFTDLAQSLFLLKRLLPQLDEHPELLASAFDWYRIGPDFGFTGYYEPELAASEIRTERFCYPLYKKPAMRRIPDRHAIDRQHALAGKGLEIAWCDDPVEIFILQIQGSGYLRYPDGHTRHVLYAGQNGKRYVALGRVMRERGYLQPDAINNESIRQWLAEHPDQRDELLDTNPGYVFFRLAETPSEGSFGRPITPWVSVATDSRVLPKGTLTFMSLPLPTEAGMRWFHGITLPQDSGGAIRKKRVDLFCGHDPESRHISSYLDTKGIVVLLLPHGE